MLPVSEYGALPVLVWVGQCLPPSDIIGHRSLSGAGPYISTEYEYLLLGVLDHCRLMIRPLANELPVGAHHRVVASSSAPVDSIDPCSFGRTGSGQQLQAMCQFSLTHLAA